MKGPGYIFLSFAAAVGLQASDLDNILTPLAYVPANSAAAGFQKAQAAPEAPAVVTSVGDFKIGERDLLTALQRELTAQMGVRGDLKIKFAEPWQPLEVKNGREWKVVVDALPKNGLGANTSIRFQIEAGGKKIGEWDKVLRAQLWNPVWVAARRLDRGEMLNPSVAVLKNMDTLTINQELLPVDADLSIYEIAQPVAADLPITARDLGLRPLVRKGRPVDVVVSEGSMSISMKGIALADAGAGQMVGVRNPDSRKDFQAQVISANTVQVKF
jgi:flagella basal body P-ring formation protein FlgA